MVSVESLLSRCWWPGRSQTRPEIENRWQLLFHTPWEEARYVCVRVREGRGKLNQTSKNRRIHQGNSTHAAAKRYASYWATILHKLGAHKTIFYGPFILFDVVHTTCWLTGRVCIHGYIRSSILVSLGHVIGIIVCDVQPLICWDIRDIPFWQFILDVLEEGNSFDLEEDCQ